LKLAYLILFATVVEFIWIGMNSKTVEEAFVPYTFASIWFIVLCVNYYKRHDN